MTKKEFESVMASILAEINEEKKNYSQVGKVFESEKIYIGMSRLLYFEMVKASADFYGVFIDFTNPLLYGHPVRIIEGIETGVYLMRSVPIFLTQEEAR